MTQPYQSEIRPSVIRDLIEKVKQQKFGAYLRRIKLVKARAFVDQTVELEFPVTALIGTNGGGKSTILGSAAIAYDSKVTRPALFFPKSSIGDESMSNWSFIYDLIDKEKDDTQLISRSAKFRKSKWIRENLLKRNILYFGIQRTVPAGERTDFKKLGSAKYVFTGVKSELSEAVQKQASNILGKDLSKFQEASISSSKNFYVGSDGDIEYSEFHFGAGESSVIRMVRAIEAAPKNSLVLIEEIENGLHPVAVRRMVEYLIETASRKSVQSIFTTHSEDALQPLPPEGIWSAIDGKVRQGKISIESLRAITGRVDHSMAIFVEDNFAKEWVESIIRNNLPMQMDQIGVYAVSGDGEAFSIHKSHSKNPTISSALKSICVLDGDSSKCEDLTCGVIKLPGKKPESEIFDFVHKNIETLSMQLAVALHLSTQKETHVKNVINDVAIANRDAHLLFAQVGKNAGLIATSIVSSAFISLWISGNEEATKRIGDFIQAAASPSPEE